jgi:WD40 repeat protein
MLTSTTLWPLATVALLWATFAHGAEPPGRIQAHRKQVTALAFSTDGTTLLSAGADGEVVAWDVKTGQERHRCPRLDGKVFAVAFSPDGKRYASAGSDGLVRVWAADTGEALASHRGHEGPVAALAFSPDGKVLASGGHDRTIRLWPDRGEPRVLTGADGRVTALAFTPDGKSLVSGGAALSEVSINGRVVDGFGHADNVGVWDVAGGKLARWLPARGTTLALLPGGRVVAAGIVPVVAVKEGEVSIDGSDTVIVADLKTGQELAVLEFRGMAVAAAPDGKAVACAAGSFEHLAGNLYLANNKRGTIITVAANAKIEVVTLDPGKKGPNNEIMFNGGGRVDHRLTVRDPATLKEVVRDEDKSVGVVAFTPDGRVLAAGRADGVIRFLAPGQAGR